MNDKKKPEPKETDGILHRITSMLESLIRRQDILSERVTTLEKQINKDK